MFIILAGAEAGLSRSSPSCAGSWVSLSFSIQGRGCSLALREGRTSTTRGWSTAGVISFSTLGSPAWLPVPPPAARAVVASCAREDRPRRHAPLGRRSCSGAVRPLHRYGCWSEGRNVTLRSKSPLLSRCSDRDSRQGHPSLRSAPDEDRRRRHPTVRPRPAQRPTCDPAHCNGPCVAAASYGPNL
jgi:hypothetical protein